MRYMLNQYCNQDNSKVKFNWTNQSIKWYLASECTTTFYKNITEKLEPFTKNCKTLLDIGCGIGAFSVEFAMKGFEVTAIDKSPVAVECLLSRARRMGLKNLDPINITFEDFRFNNNYDIIFVSYMMSLINENNIENIIQKANKHLVLVMPFNNIKNDFSVNELYVELGLNLKNLEQLNYLSTVDFLSKKNIKHDIKIINTEFGQPFNTFTEAIQFVYHYFNIPIEKRFEAAEWLNRKIIKLNNKFYLPNNKESAIIII
ncbi:MAG TPA: hypothetical protein DEF04_08610 [Clostridiales bacterium]|nr:hypothetical protein [Clostridiales bacterium]